MFLVTKLNVLKKVVVGNSFTYNIKYIKSGNNFNETVFKNIKMLIN